MMYWLPWKMQIQFHDCVEYRRYAFGASNNCAVWQPTNHVTGEKLGWYCPATISTRLFETHLQAMQVVDRYFVSKGHYLIAENEVERFEKLAVLL